MNIFDKQLFNELVRHFTIIFSVFFSLNFVFVLVRVVNEVGEGDFPVSELAITMVLALVRPLPLLLIFCTVLAAFFVMRRCCENGFLHTAFSLGVSYGQVYKVLLAFSIPMAVFVLYLVMEIVPAAEQGRIVLKQKYSEQFHLSPMSLGRLRQTPDGSVIFVQGFADNYMTGIWYASLSSKDVIDVETARYGFFIPDAVYSRFELLDGSLFRFNGRKDQISFSRYAKHSIAVHQVSGNSNSDSGQLKNFSKLVDSDRMEDGAQLFFRLSLVWVMVVMTLYSEIFNRTQPGRRSSRGLWMWILSMLAYFGLVFWFTSLMAQGKLFAVYALAAVHLAALSPLLVHLVNNYRLAYSCRNMQ